MKYYVEPWMFEKNKDVCFGIVVADGIQNTMSNENDSTILSNAEDLLISNYTLDDLKNHPDFLIYRKALQNVGINPNKYTHSVEAMSKRILKGSRLPSINALVDICNALSIKEVISLGGHDLKDIHKDLCVRKSVIGDKYLPFSSDSFEDLPAGEVIFTSGEIAQTRQWMWRQSEIGKVTLETKNVFFQLVGFRGVHYDKLIRTMDNLKSFIENRFNGTSRRFLVDKDKNSVEF